MSGETLPDCRLSGSAPLPVDAVEPRPYSPNPPAIDLAPAEWVWWPSQRTLPCSFVLFRREVELAAAPRRAVGWIAADSRYRLTVNGERVQWGPAPCDPRSLDVDPFDITRLLRPGRNVIGVEVLFYGHGDGTWPAGKPGLLLHLAITDADGRQQQVVTDTSWRCLLDRAHPPGQYPRFFLRALQEVFDARLHPPGWDRPDYVPDRRWLAPMLLETPAAKPPICGWYPDYMRETRVDADHARLRAREVPAMHETVVEAEALADSGVVTWHRSPDDWFESRMPGALTATPQTIVEAVAPGRWRVPATATDQGVYLTFVFEEALVGWPLFTIDAPAGTVVEVMRQEAHDPSTCHWLDSCWSSWSRLICREGTNHFEAFDYECLRWLQLHIRNAERPVEITAVGVRRRVYAWEKEPQFACSDPTVQQLFAAGINTLKNCAQETCVDTMGRERQQYAGEIGMQHQTLRYAFGETAQTARYLRTWSEGLTKDGYFLSSWPATDAMMRVTQRLVDATCWGPILDHGVKFGFDCWSHYLHTGDAAAVRVAYPRLRTFAGYLMNLRGADGLLPVEDLGVPTVWIDNLGYTEQRDKQCAFALFVVAMFRSALVPLARVYDDAATADRCARFADDLLKAVIAAFWCPEQKTFVCNLPWSSGQDEARHCEQSLAVALLHDCCPERANQATLDILVRCPPSLGLAHPLNAVWRYAALARHGRADVVLADLRTRWAAMESVAENNSLAEFWHCYHDQQSIWSHAAVAPVLTPYTVLAGVRPLDPGFGRCVLRPQFADLEHCGLRIATPHGPIRLEATQQGDGHAVTVVMPPGCEGLLHVPAAGPALDLQPAAPVDGPGLTAYVLGSGATHEFIVGDTVA